MTYLLLRLFQVMLFALPIYILLRLVFVLCLRPKTSAGREALLCIFFLFMSGLMVLVLSGSYTTPALMWADAMDRLQTGRGINTVPFHTVSLFFFSSSFSRFLINNVGNVVMFIPWGFFLPSLWKSWRPLGMALLAAALLPLFIESVQLFIGRQVDVDDLILNAIGSLMGYILFLLGRIGKR